MSTADVADKPADTRDGHPAAADKPAAGKVAVIRSGSWGTAVTGLLAPQVERIALWSFEPEVAEAVNRALGREVD